MRCRCLALIGLAGVLGACVNSENARLPMDHGLVLEAVNPGRAERVEPLERVAADDHELRPASTSLDRSGWIATRVRVPEGGVRHRPSYTDEWLPEYADRNEGYSPTILSALDKGDSGLESGVGEGFASVGITLFDAVALLPRALFVDPFWEFNESPEMRYERRATRPWIPLAVSPEAEDDAPMIEGASEVAPGRIQRIHEAELEVEPEVVEKVEEDVGDGETSEGADDATDEATDQSNEETTDGEGEDDEQADPPGLR